MSLFGGLPPPSSAAGAGAGGAAAPRVRRPMTQEELEEEAIRKELADLPDDEGCVDEEGNAAAALTTQTPEPEVHLRRRPRAREPSEEPEEEGGDDEGGPPVPEQHLRRRPAPASAPEGTAGGEGPVAEGEGRAAKRVCFAEPSSAEAGPAGAAGPEGDQVIAALKKITSHISNSAKFPKAAPLLRQLLEGPALSPAHRAAVFDALRAAFPMRAAEAPHLVDPALRRDVVKLVNAAEARANTGYFTRAEKAQILEVYRLLAVARQEMQTDDSFVFSKVLARVREAVDGLPESDPADASTRAAEDAAYKHILAGQPGCAPINAPSAAAAAQQATAEAAAAQKREEEEAQRKAAEKKAAESKAAAEEEDDPFGLNSLMEEPKKPAPPPAPKPPKPAEPASSAWGPHELVAAKRRAVLDCVQHARTFHKKPWTQTGVELLGEHCYQNKHRFAPAQAAELDELWVWVRRMRAQRKQGPSAKEINRDSTSFERARAEWSKATVSHRGKVGATGDAKSANWLG